MFISKFLTALLAGLVLSSTAYAKPTIQMRANFDGSHNINILLDRHEALGARFADVLIKSPLVKEVVNMYVEPQTVYQGDGFTLNLKPSGMPNSFELDFKVNLADRANMVIQGEYFHAGAIGGVINSLHRALLASTSNHTLTKARPGLISPQEGEVFVLQGTAFGEPSIGCRPGPNDSNFSMCTFELKK